MRSDQRPNVVTLWRHHPPLRRPGTEPFSSPPLPQRILTAPSAEQKACRERLEPRKNMSYETLLLFVPACFALNMAPGPNNLLSVSNATRHGFLTSCIAGAGRLLAFIGMIAIASAGLATLLLTSQFSSMQSNLSVPSTSSIWPTSFGLPSHQPMKLTLIQRRRARSPWQNRSFSCRREPQGDPHLHRIPAAVHRYFQALRASVRRARRRLPDSGVDRHRGLCLYGQPLAQVVLPSDTAESIQPDLWLTSRPGWHRVARRKTSASGT